MIVPVPVPAPRPASPPPRFTACHTVTHQWELQTKALGSLRGCQYSSQLSGICVVTFGLIVPLGSLIVSGSVYVVGNSLHWLEYQGRCDDGAIQQGLALFKMSETQADEPQKDDLEFKVDTISQKRLKNGVL
ncbi:hypothetical protein [Shewanella surugensis]|uniref:Transmembrane protein n=1 Tax=Shewanella surugensis TaxID=212020 RepID=A0ABT0LD25_9GAMM|nr:hypothetical protein [Shewanella surugensis]MCL1125579.1 hypothetical protein [Shewanella surugensis]